MIINLFGGIAMENALNNYLGKLTGRINGLFHNIRSEVINSDNQEMLRCVQKAMEEWCEAEQFFENVSDPELVDYAIYRIEACKKKYMYLLKKAKEMGVKVDYY
jgi:hypothetical protein